VAWVTAQSDGRADRIETVAREGDDDAVRIMTVHGSKGLEFPVVVLAGLNADRDVRAPLVSWGELGPEIRFGSRDKGYFETAGYGAVRESDERFEEAEQRRLLYVAATRAQDHLVVSLHHKPAPRVPSYAQLLHEVCESCQGLHTRPEAAQLSLDVEPLLPEHPVEAPEAAERWRAERAALLDRVRVSSVTSPSRLGHDDQQPVEADQRVPGRGKGGTARGVAVHAVLQGVTLPGLEDLDDLARLEATNEGLPERADEVAAIARAALDSPVVRRALGAKRFWRELSVVAEVDGRLVEGFIDLAFEDDDGRLVVVDHKTDAVEDEADLDRVAAGYRLQVAAYAAALERATGREVAEGWLVFAARDGARERRVDLATVRAELAAELAR
jgi:ATP-dependent helicase/nuclease subunit A